MFNPVFSSNTLVRVMKIPQSFPVGARSFEYSNYVMLALKTARKKCTAKQKYEEEHRMFLTE